MLSAQTQNPNPSIMCPICALSEQFTGAVLWPKLIEEWGLSEEEVAYIDDQQGTVCRGCGANLRSMALARALCIATQWPTTLDALLSENRCDGLQILEVNEAGTLHSRLRRFPGHHFATFPGIDLCKMPYEGESFDLVIHSDTIEHVEDPCRAFQEILRIGKPGGATVFTVPILVGRMTRSRLGLPPSYHGAKDTAQPDMLVHTEFGADTWVAR